MPTRSAERGQSLIGLVILLLVLGAVAATVLISEQSGSSGPGSIPTLPIAGASPAGTGGSRTSTANANPLSETSAAAVAACRASYSAAEQAVEEYLAQHGQQPTTIAEVQGYLRDPISTTKFAVAIDASRPGQLQVSTAARAASDGPTNCEFAGG